MEPESIDKRSGLTFKVKNKKKPISSYRTPETPTRHFTTANQNSIDSFSDSSINAQEDDYDLASASQNYLKTPETPTTISTHVQLLDTTPTPSNSNELYGFLPSHLDSTTKLKQLIYWSGQSELKKEQYTLNKDTMKAKKIADNLKQNYLASLANGDIPLYWFSTPLDTEIKQRPNPRNEKNLQKVKKLKAAIKDLEQEEEEWKKAANELNVFHANSVTPNESLKILEFGDNYLKEMDEVQFAKVEKALAPVQDIDIDWEIDDFRFQIDDTLQTLEITDTFQSKANLALDRLHTYFAKKIEASSTDSQKENGWRRFEDSEELHKENRNEIAIELLRSISKKQKK
ncbi:hypothetical protein BY458DRAFT_510613 [Sporodiniella umbellata]|nr:hypothetical protein BY458DRAFT_510613 [Sporodiniella umbellata]